MSSLLDEATGLKPVEKTSINSLSLRRNFSWTLLGNVVYAGCQWGILIILAKLGSPEIVGRFALGLAITAPIIIFANLHLRAVQATDAKREFFFSDYLGLRLATTLLSLLVILGFTLVNGYQWETATVIMLVGLAKAFEAVSDVYYGLLQQHERMDRIAKSMLIKGPLSLIALGIAIYMTGSLIWGVFWLAVAWAVVLFGYDIRSGSFILNAPPEVSNNKTTSNIAFVGELRPRWTIKVLRKLTWLALPLGLVMLLVSLNANIPRYFIEHYFGERELGIFAAMAYLMVAGTTVVNALGESASPRLAKYYAMRNVIAFRNLLFKLMGIGAVLGLLSVFTVLLAGREILTLLYKNEYASQIDVFVWIAIAASINYIASFLGYGMTAARYFRVQIPLFALVVITLIISSFLLIPTRGLTGAAIALAIAAIINATASLFVVLDALHSIGEKAIRYHG